MSLVPDPTDPSQVLVARATEGIFGLPVQNSVLRNVHARARCAGRHCVVHDPSPHHMADWPLVWDDGKRVFERSCEHGVGHPDPDDMAYRRIVGRGWLGIHGCDGCCAAPDTSQS